MSKKCPPPPLKLKNPPHKSPKRGIHFKKFIQALYNYLKSDWIITIKNSTYKKKALIRSVSVIGSTDTAFCDRPQNPDRCTPIKYHEINDQKK